MNSKKRVLSLLLALVMVFGVFAGLAPISNAATADPTPVESYIKVVDKDGKVIASPAPTITATANDKAVDVKVEAVQDNPGVYKVTYKEQPTAAEAKVPGYNTVAITAFDGTEQKPTEVKLVAKAPTPGTGIVVDPTTKEVREINFQLVEKQTGKVIGREANVIIKEVYHMESKNVVGNNITSEFVPAYFSGTAVDAYRQYKLVRKQADAFAEGYYKVVLEATNSKIQEAIYFRVKDGKVVTWDGKDVAIDKATGLVRFDVRFLVNEKYGPIRVQVVDNEMRPIPGATDVSIYRIKRDGNNNYIYKDGNPVIDQNAQPIVVLGATNEEGFTSATYGEENGGVRINGIFIPTPELLAVKYTDKKGVEYVQTLNIWKLKDEVKYDQMKEQILRDPVKYYEPTISFNRFIIGLTDNAIKVRVRVETYAGNDGQVYPVPGAKIEIGTPKAYAYGQPVAWDKTIKEGTTDQYGYVEFKLPLQKDMTVWGPIQNGTVTPAQIIEWIEGANIKTVNITLPYLIRQASNGNQEGHSFSDQVTFLTQSTKDKSVDTDAQQKLIEIVYKNFADTGSRISGDNRYATSVAIANKLFPNGLEKKDNYYNVVIASGEMYPDALTATTTAYNYNAPLLLVQKDAVPEAVAQYLKDVKVDNMRMIIVGGNSTISDATARELEKFGAIKRISGADRYATSVANAQDLLRMIMDNNETKFVHGHFGDHGIVYLASGENFPDALTAASPAAMYGSPLLLTEKDRVPAVVANFIRDSKVKEIRVIGGTGSVSNAVIDQLRGMNLTANRISGTDRTGTSLAIANQLFPNVHHVYITSGAGYADALTGATLAAKTGYPVILLPDANTVPEAVKEYFAKNNITSFTILGGKNTVTDAARKAINDLILAPKPVEEN